MSAKEIWEAISLKKNETVPGIYDVEMEGIERLQRYDSVECHIVLYPYSRTITSEDFAFYPFEEYVKDVLSQQRSAYVKIQSHFSEVFGLLLGLLIALVFFALKPTELLSVESIVSVFGAYLIGKELWDDIARTLVGISKRWRIRYREGYYQYQLEKHTTLTYYSYLAKRQRYGKSSLMPEKIDFIKQSNSQTLRMCFNMRDLRSYVGSVVHVLSIHLDPSLMEAFEQSGYLFGVKLSLNKEFLGIVKSWELFQSISKGAKGCLDDGGQWTEDAVFFRRTWTWGRIKYFQSKGLLGGTTIVRAEDLPSPSPRLGQA